MLFRCRVITKVGERVSHSYAKAGDYVVTLTVTDDKGVEVVCDQPDDFDIWVFVNEHFHEHILPLSP